MGYKYDDEYKKRLSVTRKGRKLNADGIRNISVAKLGDKNPMFNHTFTPDHRQKLTTCRLGDKNPTFGSPRSDEVREKIRKSKKGKVTNWNKGFKGSRIIDFKIVSPDGVVHSPTNVTQFLKEHGLCRNSMYNLINRKRDDFKGWKRYE